MQVCQNIPIIIKMEKRKAKCFHYTLNYIFKFTNTKQKIKIKKQIQKQMNYFLNIVFICVGFHKLQINGIWSN